MDEIKRLNKLIQELEAIGAWGLAQVIRNQLNEVLKGLRCQKTDN